MIRENLLYCNKCWAPETRPRITFHDGTCNACLWAEKKKSLDWSARREQLEKLCDRFRKNTWDVIIPFSGGKDSIYVAWKMRELGMTPLLITFVPHLELDVGKYNREKMREDFDCLTVTTEYERYRELAIIGFKEQGRPKLPFVTGITTSILQLAIKLDIPFIMYGEEGESEYGGASDSKTVINRQYLVDYYYSGYDPSKYGGWWQCPEQEELDKLYATHWSKFEDWDPKLHADFAIEKGMRTSPQIGTFTDYAQLSDLLQDLHAYMMYLKFGFGRCTSDVCIEIRAGRMTREEGKVLINKLDGEFPSIYLQQYLDYYKMTYQQFCDVLDSFTNRTVFGMANG